MFEIIDKEESQGTIIKVFGVGGAGGNAIEHMIREGVSGVEFIAANTDAQALARNAAASKLSLGKSGLGAGAKPEAGKAAAEAHREEIRAQLEGAHMAFRGLHRLAVAACQAPGNPGLATFGGPQRGAAAWRRGGRRAERPGRLATGARCRRHLATQLPA